MEEAQKRLDEAKRKQAFEEQEKALQELEQAKAELEEILRQLREEEIQRLLAALEARFRQILKMERLIYARTVELEGTTRKDRPQEHALESSRLGIKQGQIVLEVDKALLLLKEDGTSIALPEAVRELRDDMQETSDRLGGAKTGEITQQIEQDILAALEEILEALKKAREDSEQRQQDAEDGQSGMPADPPLVEKLAELKMIRALQLRVNRRTDRYAKLIEAERTNDPDLLDALRNLAERQERIFRITRDIEMGKNE